MRKRRVPRQGNKKKLRRKKRNPIPFLFLCLILFVGIFYFYQPVVESTPEHQPPQKGPLSEKQKLEDSEFFFNTLQENYPYFGIDEKFNKINFLENKEHYIKLIEETKDDESYFEALNKIAGDLGGEVTFLNKREYDEFLKYENISSLKLWIDTLKQETVKNRYQSMRITEASEIPEELTMTTPVPNEVAYIKIKDFNPLLVDSDGKKIKDFIQNLKGYHSLIIDIRDNQGISVEYFLENLLVPLSNNYYKSTSTILEKKDQYTKYLDAYQSDYFTNIPEKQNRNDLIKNYNVSKERADHFEYGKQYSIRVEPQKSYPFKGKVYILQNTKTKYAADTFSQFANQTDFATTVGTTTGGNGVNISNVFLSLPLSGYVFQMPVGMGLNADGSSNYELGTTPILNYPDSDHLLNTLIKIIQSS